jgi:hypothetical protein
MRIEPEQALPQTVTILNKLKKSDANTSTDVWYKKTLKNCVWSVVANSSQTGTQTNLGYKVTVQIPKAQEIPFKPYTEWKEAGMQDTAYTVSLDDYIVLGEVTESITSQNIVTIMKKYEPNACKVRLFEDCTFNGLQLDGFLQQYANIYYVEGV